jgi:hypothetical protein
MDAADIRVLLAVCKDAVYDCKKMKRLESVPDVYHLSSDEETRVAFFAGYVEGQRKITEQIAVAIRESCMPDWKNASHVVAEELEKIASGTPSE